ncbi:hypothetical protein OROHE_004797 [Orobanche hederae]
MRFGLSRKCRQNMEIKEAPPYVEPTTADAHCSQPVEEVNHQLNRTEENLGEGEGDRELEAEIMDFMAKSEKPTMFPTK